MARAPEIAIERLGENHSPAVELAERAAFAVRCEPVLLRRLRLDLAPALDVGAESELWSSSLVQARSPIALVLRPAVSRALRAQLMRRAPELASSVRMAVRAEHAGMPETVRLEEELLYLTACLETADNIDAVNKLREEIAGLLAWALRRLRLDGTAKPMSRWAYRALPALSESLRHMPEFAMLLHGASASLSLAPPVAGVPFGPPVIKAIGALLSNQFPRLDVGVRRTQDQLRLSLPPQGDDRMILPLPDLEPLQVEVFRRAEAEPIVINLALNEERFIAVERGTVILRTALGETARLPDHEIPVSRSILLITPGDPVIPTEAIASDILRIGDQAVAAMEELLPRDVEVWSLSAAATQQSFVTACRSAKAVVGLHKPHDLTVSYRLAQARLLGLPSLLMELETMPVRLTKTIRASLRKLLTATPPAPLSGMHWMARFGGWETRMPTDTLTIEPVQTDTVQAARLDPRTSYFFKTFLDGVEIFHGSTEISLAGLMDLIQLSPGNRRDRYNANINALFRLMEAARLDITLAAPPVLIDSVGMNWSAIATVNIESVTLFWHPLS